MIKPLIYFYFFFFAVALLEPRQMAVNSLSPDCWTTREFLLLKN